MGWKDLEAQLTRRFGLGAVPLITKRLYRRLQRELDQCGEPVMLIISECAEGASTAHTDPGSWFRAAVVGRLKDAGYLQRAQSLPGPNQARSLVNQVADRFVRSADKLYTKLGKEVPHGQSKA